MAYDNFLVDKRVVERNIKKGLVDPEQLKQQIETLPDRESNCVHVSLEGSAPADDSADERLDEADADAGLDVDDADDDADDDAEDTGEELAGSRDPTDAAQG